MKKLLLRFAIVFLLFLTINSCLEEFPILQLNEFEELLVVEAAVTNEFKKQSVKLSRVYRVDEQGPKPESGAFVKVNSSSGETYNFNEIGDQGIYLSVDEFAAVSNTEYTLEITTKDDRSYISDPMLLTQETKIDSIYAVRDFNENNEEGVSIYIDSYDPTGKSKYYRFKYEETYKIIAPSYSPLELIPLEVVFPIEIVDSVFQFPTFAELVPREEQKQICFNTKKSNNIIQASTIPYSEDKLDRFRVRFIKRDNYIISHRYSILVEQIVQSRDAFSFYQILSNFSEQENIFSSNQVGTLEGNIYALNDIQEKVIGFFSVSTVFKKRVYFNYDDLFPDEQLPPYVANCDNFIAPREFNTDPYHPNLAGSSPLIDALKTGFQFFQYNEEPNIYLEGPYLLVAQPCGDCTILGNNIAPDFWID